MSGSVFLETLRRRRMVFIWWAVGVALMAIYIIVLLPDVKSIQSYSKLIQGMPSFIMSALGTDVTALASPAGFLGYIYFGWLILALAAYGVIYGLDITSNDEEGGMMDLLLSLPLPRWRIVLEKFLAYTVGLVFIVLVSMVSLVWGISTSAGLSSITPGQVIGASLNFIPSVLLVMAFTALLASAVRRRGTVAAIASLFVVASWLIDTIGRSAPSADGLRVISFLKYYNGASVAVNGIAPLDILGLLGVALIFLIGAIWLFDRRDVGV